MGVRSGVIDAGIHAEDTGSGVRIGADATYKHRLTERSALVGSGSLGYAPGPRRYDWKTMAKWEYRW